MAPVVRKTFEEFWGELLLVRFHAGSSASLDCLRTRRDWVLENADDVRR